MSKEPADTQNQAIQTRNPKLTPDDKFKTAAHLEYRPPAAPFWNPNRVILAYFAGLILVGGLLLMLPLAAQSGETTAPLVAFFTATSATCVTGLVLVDTGSYWSGFGHVVIFILIELGGLGFASSSILVLLPLHRRLNLNDRIMLRSAIGSIKRRSVLQLSLFILGVTVVVQGVGAILLFLTWNGQFDTGKALWWAVFHSASAFTNAGFDLLGTQKQPFISLTGYTTNYPVCLTISGLIFVGSLGFVVIAELLEYPRTRRLSLLTRVVILASLALCLFGTLFIWLVERNNPDTIGSLSLPDQFQAAFFQSVSPRTAGFNTVNLAALLTPSQLMIMLLMFIGGGSGSAAGGLKVSTFVVILASLRSVALGLPGTVIGKRTIPQHTVGQALAIGGLYTVGIAFFTLIISFFDRIELISILFEVISAFCTVGLSLGATPTLSIPGKFILMVAMFIGRLGPLLLILALVSRKERRNLVQYPEEDVAIG
ncbi:MAG TPA: potassium transporter TrkG [Chloroflexia bacterium]|nr:potassium transporter TrkG [Chloroflexia bacterium]